MATTSYQKKLLDPRWQKKRLKIFERDNWTCQQCGSSEKTLHVHHTSYSGEPWDIQDYKLKTLCHECHDNEHNGLETKPKANAILMFDKVIEISGDYLLSIPHEDLGKKSKDNIYGISAYLQYTYSYYSSYKHTKLSDFKSHFKNPSFTLKEYVEMCSSHLHRDCVRSNVYLTTPYGNFGYKENVLYGTKLVPFSFFNIIKRIDQLRIMSEEEYRKLYKHSKMNRLECINDLCSGINRDLKVLEIGFTYNNNKYGV